MSWKGNYLVHKQSIQSDLVVVYGIGASTTNTVRYFQMESSTNYFDLMI